METEKTSRGWMVSSYVDAIAPKVWQVTTRKQSDGVIRTQALLCTRTIAGGTTMIEWAYGAESKAIAHEGVKALSEKKAVELHNAALTIFFGV